MKETGNACRLHAGAWFVVLVTVTAWAAATGTWFPTAAPVGFLVGFFLHQGDLRGSSAMSDVTARGARRSPAI